MLGGLVLLFSLFLSLTTVVWFTAGVTVAMVIIPMVYSYSIYKQHQKEGIVYGTPKKRNTGNI